MNTQFFFKYKFEILGSILGLFVGLGYWYFVGCTSGTCSITSKPLNSAALGAIMGGLFFSR